MKPQYPIIISTLFQRLALGVYTISLFSVYFWDININLANLAVASFVIFVIGLLASVLHLGKPTRLLNSFANPKSHLTQEGFFGIFVSGFLFLQAIDGRFFEFNDVVITLIQGCIVLFSLLFIFSTGLVYQLFARPAWKTKLVSINFFLSFLSIGSVGTYTLVIALGGERSDTLLYLSVASTLMTIIGQFCYKSYVGKLGYGVAVQAMRYEFKSPFIAWLLTGVVIPLAVIGYALFAEINLVAALLLFISSMLGLFFWRVFFFLTGKEIKFFPQYESDMKTIF